METGAVTNPDLARGVPPERNKCLMRMVILFVNHPQEDIVILALHFPRVSFPWIGAVPSRTEETDRITDAL